MEKSPLQCKYFLHGACSKGSQCKFVHDVNAKPDNTCKFYLAGSCSYGKKCRYNHVKPKKKLLSLSELSQRQTSRKEKEKSWLEAPVFVPGVKSHKTRATTPTIQSEEISYSSAVRNNSSFHMEDSDSSYIGEIQLLLCPFAAVRECPYGKDCEYLHGDICDMCGCQCLHPTDQHQREVHKRDCALRVEQEMELAFAAQRSEGVACSICLDIVKEKSDISERVFGLLENCVHPFCLSCIRKWRVSCNQQKAVIRSCPICRQTSWFITPSEYWVEDPQEKSLTIEKYKSYLSNLPCRNFDQGRGDCQFGSSCFYKHMLPNGNLDDSEPNIRYLEDADGISSAMNIARLNDFIEARDDDL